MAKPKPHRTEVKSFPSPVRSYAMRLEKWLLSVTAYRESLSVDDRLETLLWSWPIRRAITAQDMTHPLWLNDTRPKTRAVLTRRRMHNANGTEQLRGDIEEHLPLLAHAWYPFGPPRCQLRSPADQEHHKVCALLCDELRQLGKVMPHEANETAALARFIEEHWGDGQYEYRCKEQQRIVKMLNPRDRLRICRIAEEARDQAYVSILTTRLLDDLRETKDDLNKFIDWLGAAPDHAPLVNRLLRPLADETITDETYPVHAQPIRENIEAFYEAFQTLVANYRRLPEFLRNESRANLDHKSRDRRARRGKPRRRLWVQPAEQSLKRLKLKMSAQDRRALLIAWGLVPPERAVISQSRPRL